MDQHSGNRTTALIKFCLNNRALCCLCMVYCLNGLWHNAIISRYHEHNNIGYLCASGAHCSKCLMARGIQKSYITFVKMHMICAYMLGYASCLAPSYIGLSYSIQEGSLTMVNMPHNSN